MVNDGSHWQICEYHCSKSSLADIGSLGQMFKDIVCRFFGVEENSPEL